ncbi:MAG: phosphatidate cytidylyltransferase [Planctomycetes bacterium]|nr:phosphatidate cytidylyltransferase [Planctomycetota bacterium]
MLGWRLFLGPILIAALIGLFWLDTQRGATAPILALLALGLGFRSTWELVQLLRVRFQPQFGLTVGCVLAVIASNWYWLLRPETFAGTADAVARLGPVMLVVSLAVALLFVNGLWRYEAPGRSLETLGSELLVLSYVGVFVSLVVQMRWLDSAKLGYLPLASLVVATKCGDTAAYFTGRALGKTKLCPKISPGKTRAGGVGALVGAALGSVAWFHWAGPGLFGVTSGPWYAVAFYGVVLGLVGLVGDLAESLIKRDVGQKDSAPLLPGFGGLLDLLDSILFTAPVAYLLWLVLPLVG